MRTNGIIYLHPSPQGDILVYEDQLIPLNARISKCKTRDEARGVLHDMKSGVDFHHLNDDFLILKKKDSPSTSPITANRPSTVPAQAKRTVNHDGSFTSIQELE